MNKNENRGFYEHIKDVFKPDVLIKLRDEINNLEQQGVNLSRSEREQGAVKRGESSDLMRMRELWYEVWREPKEELTEYLGLFKYVIYPVQIRHIVKRVGQHVPWHQDAGYIKLLPKQRQHSSIITCFIPLEIEPFKHTTLEFADDKYLKNTNLLNHSAMDGFGAGLNLEFSKTIHYKLNLGDALIFGDHAFHRTYTPPGAIVERRSLEFRLICSKNALKNKDYFDIDSQKFVRI